MTAPKPPLAHDWKCTAPEQQEWLEILRKFHVHCAPWTRCESSEILDCYNCSLSNIARALAAAPVAVPAGPKCILCGKIADEHSNRLWCSESEDSIQRFTPPLDAPPAPLPPPQEPTVSDLYVAMNQSAIVTEGMMQNNRAGETRTEADGVILKTTTGVTLSVERYNELAAKEDELITWRGRTLCALQCLRSFTGINDLNELQKHLDEDTYWGLLPGITVEVSEEEKDWMVPIAHEQGMTLGAWINNTFHSAARNKDYQALLAKWNDQAIALAAAASRIAQLELELEETQRAKYGTPCKCDSWIKACDEAETRAETAEAALTQAQQERDALLQEKKRTAESVHLEWSDRGGAGRKSKGEKMRHFYLRSAAGFPVACIASTILKQDGTLSDGPLSEGDRIAFAFSIHNPKDEFDRHMARRVAEGRLLKRHGDIVIDTQKDIKLRIVETLLGSVEHLAKPLPKRVQDAARHWLARHDARAAVDRQHDSALDD